MSIHLQLSTQHCLRTQGAKPGKGGILPAEKITTEIAVTRGIPMGEDYISPLQSTYLIIPIKQPNGRKRKVSHCERCQFGSRYD
ncbi:glutamate synthase-related protein [Sphingosinicella microcystinivorans]|uniref:glutamate synthase-related protein n=1 Tax=Sphingosinicella microcystinivorans TaxID=335406 RepID=UPI003B8483EC